MRGLTPYFPKNQVFFLHVLRNTPEFRGILNSSKLANSKLGLEKQKASRFT